jgi:hypothetical protein
MGMTCRLADEHPQHVWRFLEIVVSSSVSRCRNPHGWKRPELGGIARQKQRARRRQQLRLRSA